MAITDADKPLINNKITSGDGNDYIYLRNAIGNTVYTGSGDDLIEIEGAPQTKFTNYFQNNSIDTEKGDDTVKIFGNFDKFQKNRYYLGKGSDTFIAEINPNEDATTDYDYNKKMAKYMTSVSDNEVYATDYNKGWFEKNTFETKTYSANQLSENVSIKAISKGFQNIITKPIPVNNEYTPPKKETPKSSKNKIEDCKRRYWAGSLGYNLFHDSKMQEAAFKALDDYLKLMTND